MDTTSARLAAAVSNRFTDISSSVDAFLVGGLEARSVRAIDVGVHKRHALARKLVYGPFELAVVT
jgi:hypothetical protein